MQIRTLNKFKINNLSYFIFLVFLLNGYIKNIIIIFLIIITHELGHIFFLKIFKIKIDSITIYPFGGITKTSKLINSSINKDIIIYLGGIFFQILLHFFFLKLLKINLITLNTFNIFKTYNKSILIFNVLPIKPLDGGLILNLILDKILPFKYSYKISNYLSIIFLFIFIIFNINYNLNSYIVISFLIFNILKTIKNTNNVFNKFLLERYLYNLPYKKIKYENTSNLAKLKKETFHYLNYKSEKKVLSQKFKTS